MRADRLRRNRRNRRFGRPSELGPIAYLEASPINPDDSVGIAVAISGTGDTLAIAGKIFS